ncbi:hypothetical protein EDB32_12367 [Vibrio crassostreae]|nr:hypothetical protein EDB32_12367 [Vibrio crassostreae]
MTNISAASEGESLVEGGRTFGVQSSSQVNREKLSSRAGINIEWRKSSNQQGALLVGKGPF